MYYNGKYFLRKFKDHNLCDTEYFLCVLMKKQFKYKDNSVLCNTKYNKHNDNSYDYFSTTKRRTSTDFGATNCGECLCVLKHAKDMCTHTHNF